MNTPDQDIVLTAIEGARRILGEHIALGQRDATGTVHRLIAVLDRDEVVNALDRMKRRRTLALWNRGPRPIMSGSPILSRNSPVRFVGH